MFKATEVVLRPDVLFTPSKDDIVEIATALARHLAISFGPRIISVHRCQATYYVHVGMLSSEPSRSGCVWVVATPLITPQEREDLGGPSGGPFEGWPVPVVVEQHEVPVGNVVQDCDADLEGHYPVIASVDQQDGRLDPGELRGFS